MPRMTADAVEQCACCCAGVLLIAMFCRFSCTGCGWPWICMCNAEDTMTSSRVCAVVSCCCCVPQVAILLAPVAFVTHVDSIPLLTLAQLNTDQVRAGRRSLAFWRSFVYTNCQTQDKRHLHVKRVLRPSRPRAGAGNVAWMYCAGCTRFSVLLPGTPTAEFTQPTSYGNSDPAQNIS